MNKNSRKRSNELIDIKSIKEELRLIEGTEDYYITRTAEVYHKYTETGYYKLKSRVNVQSGGYVYISLQLNGKAKSFRLHRLVAKAFLPNPNNLPQIDHIDNNKENNHVDNLQWVTAHQNAQKRNDDGLLINDKGFEDSQSTTVVCFTPDKQVYQIYGSICLAHKDLGISKSTITRQIKQKRKKIRCGYYFRSLAEYKEKGFVL